MRKVFNPLLLVLVFSIVLIGCGVQESSGVGDRITIVSTIFTPYDFARRIAGDSADVSMLLPPASESHSFEPTTQDMMKIRNSDIFIYVGGESDAWVEDILSGIDTNKVKVITLMDCVSLVEEEFVEGMQAEGEEEDEGAYDEHVWTSPANAKLIVQKISDAMIEVDSENADIYAGNTVSYLEKISELDLEFKSIVSNASRKTIIFGDRFPFRYFVEEYGLSYYAAFPGCSAETEASAQTVKFLIDKVRDEQVPVVFHLELSNERMAQSISEQTNAKVLELHACHNISRADFDSGIGYIDLMYRNVGVLTEALQ